MKPILLAAQSVLVLACSLSWSHAAPLAKLTLQSYGAVQDSVTRFAQAIKPDGAENAAASLGMMLGITDEKAFDATKPWQAALWYEGRDSMPVIALKIPTADVAAFREALHEEGLLTKAGQSWKQLNSSYGRIAFADPTVLSESQQSSLSQWESEGLASPSAAVGLQFNLNDSLRQEFLSMFGEFKTNLSQAMATNEAMQATSTNATVMAEFFELYFGMIETTVQGLNQLDVGLDVGEETIDLDYTASALAGSQLAQWIEPPAHGITLRDLNLIDPAATLSGAAYFPKNTMESFNFGKFVELSLQMQNIDPDSPVAEEMMALVDAMFPFKVVGSGSFTGGLSFAGAYEFPEANTSELYARIKRFYREQFQGFVGEDKMYSSAKLEESHHVVNGLAVDRYTMTINTNSELFAIPMQQQQFSMLWPDAKIEIDYALKGNRLYFATPDRMEAVLQADQTQVSLPWAETLKPTTGFVGYFNFLEFLKMSMESNPMVPQVAKDMFGRMDPAGTAYALQVDTDDKIHARLKIPMKLLREMGRMGQPPQTEGNEAEAEAAP